MAVLRTLHRWLGLLMAVPLLMQGATGFLMVISPPLEALQRPAVSSPPGSPHSVSAIIAVARDAAGPNLVPARYEAGGTEREAAVVDLAAPSQRVPQTRFYIDPVSLEVLGQEVHPDRVYRWLHQVHETLFIAAPFGRSVVGWCGLGLLLLALTGVPLFWPRHGRWRAALTVPFKSRGYRLQRGLHGAAGGWVALLLVLQGVSGVAMAFPQTAGELLGASLPRPPPATLGARADIDLDRVELALQMAAPRARLMSLRFPAEPGRPLVASLRPKAAAADGPPLVVFLDPVTHRVLGMRGPAGGTAGAALLAWLRTLHEGAGFGPVWRAAVGLAGLSLLMFPITGVAMWLLRRASRRQRRAKTLSMKGAGE